MLVEINIGMMPTTATNNMFSFGAYPFEGVFGDITNVYFVADGIVTFLTRSSFSKLFKEKTPDKQTTSGITANDLLKAIAISMQPDLAKELTC